METVQDGVMSWLIHPAAARHFHIQVVRNMVDTGLVEDRLVFGLPPKQTRDNTAVRPAAEQWAKQQHRSGDDIEEWWTEDPATMMVSLFSHDK